MSYRAFKRLLGETSLERKCLCLFGIGTLVLISSIFWGYANRTEALAYEQMAVTGRVLALHLFANSTRRTLQAGCSPESAAAEHGPARCVRSRHAASRSGCL